jgi:hypothetical protein
MLKACRLVVASKATGWTEILNANGYEKSGQIGEPYDLVEAGIWRQEEDGHLLVELNIGADDYSNRFFVRPEHVVHFFLTEAPKLAGAWAQVETAYQLQKITKTLGAFVRHGHGVDTIDEDGDRSLDDERHFRQWILERQIARAKEKKS